MCEKLDHYLISCNNINNSVLYKLNSKNIYIISNKATRKLLTEPEIIGYTIPRLLQESTVDFLSWLKDNNKLSPVNVFNILRGGLNFPIEEACYYSGINVNGVSFISSERVFLDKKVSRIETVYRKINAFDNSSIIIGDIIASGVTLRNAINYIEEVYAKSYVSLRSITILTIGTKNTFDVIEELERKLKKRWPNFESITVAFFEGIFGIYVDKGITGLNLPRVDFNIKNALVSPAFRKKIIDRKTAIFEKCVIYDGGARRFEPLEHTCDLLNYWGRLNTIASTITTKDFLKEKYGYNSSVTYNNWKKRNFYSGLSDEELLDLYNCEIAYLKKFELMPFSNIASYRYKELEEYYSTDRSFKECQTLEKVHI